jgi:hypothetical protein
MNILFQRSMKKRSSMKGTIAKLFLLIAFVGSVGGGHLSARTLYFSELDMVGVAVISSDAPELSWAAVSMGSGTYTLEKVSLSLSSTLLIRFPIEAIPEGYRIVRAELSIPVIDVPAGKDPILIVRRMQGDWGMGVNYNYRMQHPEKVLWEEAGAKGTVKDRSASPSAVAKIGGAGHYRVVVTQDVDMWYTGSVPNYGWSVSLEESNARVNLATCWTAGTRFSRSWQLIVTYEPARKERPRQ